jgi:flavin reductase (DIM6/NTAB) family NADH-FMN oxidoreductase RutF
MENQSGNINPAAMFKLSYGLFVLTAKDGDKDNGCIINTASQLTSTPLRLSITVNKANFTRGMILKTREFNVSILAQSAPFSLFERFGFHSGKDTDKFSGTGYAERASNGILYVPEHVNAVISAKVKETVDCGTHALFIADITQTLVLSNEASATYQYYFDSIKPKPPKEQQKKKGYVCKICGYVHEGDVLPDDFICPICKHGAADFEPL